MTQADRNLSDSTTYVSLASVNEESIQNVQELASIWGDVRADIESFGGELRETYCMLGRFDYLLIFDAPNRGVALQIAVAVERYGLDMETMQVVPVENLGEVVSDI